MSASSATTNGTVSGSSLSSSSTSGAPRQRPVYSLGPVLKHLERVSLDGEPTSGATPSARTPSSRNRRPQASASPPVRASPSRGGTPLRSPSPHIAFAAASASPSPSPVPASPASAASFSASPPPSASISSLASCASSSSSSSSIPTARRGPTIDPARPAAADAKCVSTGAIVEPTRVVEVYDLPRGALTSDLLATLGPRALAAHVVDSAHVLVVFESETSARDARVHNTTAYRMRSMHQASDAGKALVPQIVAPIQSRPQMENRPASRLVAGALGLRVARQSPDQREEERRQRDERRRRQEEAREEAREAANAANGHDGWD